jgi:hypothetical protein
MQKPAQPTATLTHFLDFSKASPEALDQILGALNAEVDRALLENRFPSVEGAFLQLGSLSSLLQ